MTAVHGRIERRLLRPHVVAVGTVVGCCLLEVAAIRPAGVPHRFGRRLRAAAHRISVEWEDGSGETAIGVYVPVRHTDSRLATVLGGRWFPGVHEPATVDIDERDGLLWWSSRPTAVGSRLAVRVAARILHDDLPGACDPVGQTCLGAAIGLSPGRGRDALEAARMDPAHRNAVPVVIDDLGSEFIESFASAVPATSYLMRDVEVLWTRAAA